MSYDLERARLGRQPRLICEIDLDFCANVYSENHPNLLEFPEAFDNAAWTKTNATINADAAAAPDGNFTADKLVEDNTASAPHNVEQTETLVISTAYAWSCYAKPAERSKITMRTDAAGAPEITFDLTGNGAAVEDVAGADSFGIEAQADGSYLCFMLFTETAGASRNHLIYLNDGSSKTYNGDGASGAFIWGAQLTTGATLFRYGVAECTAALAAGSECYNTRETCQDTINFVKKVPRTYQFADALIPGENFLHCIASSDLAPTVISPEKGLGLRASINVNFNDFSHHDRGVDPYVATRNYTPEDQGTYFGKLLARNAHYAGRPLRIKTGYVADTFDIQDFQTRHYIIDNITGPDQRGNVTIRAKDILKLADNKQAEAPAVSTGDLVAAITDTATSLTVTSGTEGEYNLEGDYIVIGDEIILSPVANRSANVFSNLTREVFGTEKSAHDLGDQVQACKFLNDVNIVDLVRDLIKNYTDIPDNFIVDADWNTERDNWFSTATISTLIAKPEGVNKLINALAEQFYFQVYWQEIDQEIIFNPIVPPRLVSSVVELDESAHLVADQTRVMRDDDKRLTRVIFYFNPRNPLEFDDPEDYEGLHVQIAVDEESAELFDDKRQKVVFARFVQTSGQAVQTSGRILSRFRTVPRTITFHLDAKNSEHWTGDIIEIDSRRLQGVDGANEIAQFQITSAKELTRAAAGSEFQYKGLETNFFGRYAYIGPNTLNDYDVETDSNKSLYGFIAPDTAIFSDNTLAYLII